MLMDIYNRDPQSTNYDPTRLEVNDELSELILKIENTLFTRKTEVLGDPNFGANLEDLLFSLIMNESAIVNTINSQIASYCVPGFSNYRIEAKVKFFSTIERDGALIDIFINDQRVIGALF
jgi:hypothetical protein